MDRPFPTLLCVRLAYHSTFVVVVVEVVVVTQVLNGLNERHKYALKSWKHLHARGCRGDLASLERISF